MLILDRTKRFNQILWTLCCSKST